MAIHTFSTKTKKPEDEARVQRVKKHCESKCLTFSGVILKLLAKYEEEEMNGRQD